MYCLFKLCYFNTTKKTFLYEKSIASYAALMKSWRFNSASQNSYDDQNQSIVY